MSDTLEQLANRLLSLPPDQQFVIVSQLFTYPDKHDLAWAIVNRICAEHDAEKIRVRHHV